MGGKKPMLTCVAFVALCGGCAEKPETRVGGRDAVESASPGTGAAGGRAERREKAPVRAAGAADQATPPSVPADVFDRRADVSFRAASLPEVLDDLRAKTGLRSAYVRDADAGLAFTFEAKGVTVAEVLAKLAEVGGLAYDTSGDVALLWSVRDQEVRRRLDRTKLSFEFIDTPLEQALRFLAVAGGVDIHLDSRQDENRGTPITLEVTDMTFRLALTWVLKLADLEFAVRGGVVVVSKRELIETAEVPAARPGSSRRRRRAGERVLKLLDDALALTDEDVRRISRRAMARWAGMPVGALVGSAPDGEPEGGAEALVLELLADAITERDGLVLRHAADLAFSLGDCRFGEEFKRRMAVIWRALHSEDEKARREARAALGWKRDEKAVEKFHERIADACRRTRPKAVRALSFMHPDDALPYVEQVLLWPEDELRAIAVALLPGIGGARAPLLAEKALADASGQVRAYAASALCQMADEERLRSVVDALRDPEDWVRAAAVDRLGEIRGKKAVALLEEALDDPSLKVRSAAVRALGEAGGERVVVLLKKVQADEEGRRGRKGTLHCPRRYLMLSCAGEALVRIGSEKAMALVAKSVRDHDEDVARHVVGKLAFSRSANGLLMLEKVLGMEELDLEVPGWTQELRQQLERPASFEFADTPFTEALQSMQTLTRVTIILDPGAFGEGKPGDRPVTLRVVDMSLLQALKKLLAPIGLDYALRDGAVFVSTPERLAGGRRDHSPVRSAALEALDGFRGNFVRDSLVERAAVEPSAGMRRDIVSRLQTFYGGDPVVKESLERQATTEAEAERARRRARIRAERLRREGRPPPPHGPVESAAAPEAAGDSGGREK